MKARFYGVLALLAVAGVGLAAAVVLQAMSALGLGRPDPRAELKEAGRAIARASSDADFQAVAGQAREVLDRAPLEAGAVSLMAVAEDRSGKRAQARRLIAAAAALSHRDEVSDLWLFDEAMEAGKYDDAFTRADALLRRDLEAHRPVLGVLIAAANGDSAAIDPLARRLAGRPRWRESFFDAALRHPLPGFVYPLFEAMQAAGKPPTAGELEAFLRQLAAEGSYEQAYLAWLLSLSSDEMKDLGYLYDGGFEGRATIAPFGWRLSGGAGGGAAIEASPEGGGRALLVSSDGYTPGVFAQQLIVLPPGAYTLSGRVQAASSATDGQLVWSLACQPQGAEIATAPATATGGAWKSFSIAFTVPAAGCPAQQLALKGLAGDQRTSLAVWYDAFDIQPAAAGPALAEARP